MPVTDAYNAPVKDMKFVLHELWDASELSTYEGYEDASPEVIDAMLEEAAKFMKNELLPLNQTGDREGCTLENGVVRTPTGFKEAYDKYCENGFTSLSTDPKYGGTGLPHTVEFMVQEMVVSTNMAFGMYPGLSHGCYNAIYLHGSEEQKDQYLPKLNTGEWSGTMCLTEPHCGTDLGMIKTKAEPKGDGSFAISGQKIFISAGEHDLTENIVHLVLAKLPDAPEGVKGISLFLVPKFIPNAQNQPGERNGVRCNAIEEKMGIHGNATCQLFFDGAIGWMVGQPNKGLSAMFTMMNAARLGVGMQGLGIGELAFQSAFDYAKDRGQGRSLSGTKSPDQPADSILVHPDVRRMLLRMKANNEGGRAMAAWIALNIDKSLKHADPEVREQADDFVQLMTPIIKSYMTDAGSEAANLGVQTMGGHGYIEEWGMEQLVRDARIAQIYEGTNGIQALDLAGRKLGAHFGRYLRSFFHPVSSFIEENAMNPDAGEFIGDLAKSFGWLQQATGQIAQSGLKDPEEVGAASSDYLRLFALTALAFLWCQMALKAKEAIKEGRGDTAFYEAKIKTARFFYKRMLPEAQAMFKMIGAGKETIMALDEDDFSIAA
jgi:alkylation response protein AidB-like acyl-CoA dehydrogenase